MQIPDRPSVCGDNLKKGLAEQKRKCRVNCHDNKQMEKGWTQTDMLQK